MWVGLQRGFVGMGLWYLPRGFVFVDFTSFEIIASTFVGRLSSGESWMSSSSVSMNHQWIIIPWWSISGR